MNIDFKKNDSLTASLTVSIDKADYQNTFEEEIKKQRKNAHLKGFRKGKTPLGYVKKMYGDGVLAQMINEKAVNAIYDHLKENNIETILDPIFNDDQGMEEITYKNQKDYKFTFEVALTPEFEVQGVTKEDEFVKYLVVPSEKELEENLEKIAEQLGDNVTVEDSIDEKDIVTLMADVLLTDEEGLTEPIESEIKFLVSDTKEPFINEVQKLKLNDRITVNMSAIEEKDEDFIRKYYLKLEDGDSRSFPNEIDASIVNVERNQKMEVGEALFKKMFPEEENLTKESVMDKVKERTSADHASMAENVLFRSVMDKMMENTTIELSDEFLLKWAKRANAMKEGVDEAQFLEYLRNDIKWNLIKGSLVKKYGIEVAEEDLLARAKEQVKGYFGYKVAEAGPYIDMLAQNLMNDKEQRTKLWDEALTIKMYKAIETDVAVKYEEKNVEEFYALVEEINKQK